MQVATLDQHAFDDRQQRIARRREPGQALAGTNEKIDAEFVLEFADLTADAGLRGVEGDGSVGQIEAAAHGFAYGAQLLKIHGRRILQAHDPNGNDRFVASKLPNGLKNRVFRSD